MNILFVVPYMPTPIRTRPYNLVRKLAAQGNQVTLLTLFQDMEEEAASKEFRADGIEIAAFQLSRRQTATNVLRAVSSGHPMQAQYCWQPELAEELRARIRSSPVRQRPDVIHIEHLRGALYGLLAKKTLAEAGLATPVVWDSVDSISNLFRQAAAHSRTTFGRWITRAELSRTERAEANLVWQFDRVLTTSPADRQALISLGTRLRHDTPPVTVLANGVDLDYFQPGPANEREANTLILSGKMSYHANATMALYLAEAIMPLVWSSLPETRLNIVGKDPDRAVKALGQDERITVTGAVADMRPYLQRAAVAVAPMRYGAGIQNKILEAMACATPVVTVPDALTALEAVAERDLLVGSDAAGIAGAITALLKDDVRREAIGKAGNAYVSIHHDWWRIANQLQEVYEAALSH